MYINKITIENFGPLHHLVIDCPFDDHQNPLPIILVGTNGSGKTSIIANLIDALVELKRKKYKTLQEVDEGNYLKVGKKNYITIGKKYSYVNIEFEYDNKSAYYVDFSRIVSHEEFTKEFDLNNFENINWKDQKLTADGYFKSVTAENEFLETFEKEVILYFPFSRYEVPAWWNPEHELGFHLNEKYIGVSDRNFIKSNVVKEVEEWILNVFLDAELYDKKTGSLAQILGKENQLPDHLKNLSAFFGYSGKNTSLKNSINQLLTKIYKVNNPAIEYVRLGISDKNYRRISVLEKKEGKPECEIAPTFSHLSSGQLMVLSLFCSILKEYDQLDIGSVVNLNEIKGTVIIDEIDLHLHINLQKDLLPSLIQQFPKIQFIITTHSPLFLLGIEKSFPDIKAVNLPQGNLIPLSEFSEVEHSFDIFVEKFSSFRESYEFASNAINNLTKPLVITEGKTDWKHFKKALERFKEINEFNSLEFDFLEYEDEINMGDSELLSLCEQFQKTQQARKIICIFDRDNPKITNKITDPFIDFGNNVYAFCIAKPDHRKDYHNISIEFLYSDSELKTLDKNGKRLLFSNEVEKRLTQPMSRKSAKIDFITLDTPLEADEYTKKIYDQDIESVVDDKGNVIGLSKSVFAQYILENKEGFTHFDINPFRSFFETIEEIIKI